MIIELVIMIIERVNKTDPKPIYKASTDNLLKIKTPATVPIKDSGKALKKVFLSHDL